MKKEAFVPLELAEIVANHADGRGDSNPISEEIESLGCVEHLFPSLDQFAE